MEEGNSSSEKKDITPVVGEPGFNAAAQIVRTFLLKLANFYGSRSLDWVAHFNGLKGIVPKLSPDVKKLMPGVNPWQNLMGFDLHQRKNRLGVYSVFAVIVCDSTFLTSTLLLDKADETHYAGKLADVKRVIFSTPLRNLKLNTPVQPTTELDLLKNIAHYLSVLVEVMKTRSHILSKKDVDTDLKSLQRAIESIGDASLLPVDSTIPFPSATPLVGSVSSSLSSSPSTTASVSSSSSSSSSSPTTVVDPRLGTSYQQVETLLSKLSQREGWADYWEGRMEQRSDMVLKGSDPRFKAKIPDVQTDNFWFNVYRNVYICYIMVVRLGSVAARDEADKTLGSLVWAQLRTLTDLNIRSAKDLITRTQVEAIQPTLYKACEFIHGYSGKLV